MLYNLRSAGFDALPIVGLLSFLLGIVVAYQGAGQLRQYGANIFVADLVGLSMLREFAPLITAIIIAGRSGSAYAAQIGTMSVTEEIDALRTLGIAPLDLLVLPKNHRPLRRAAAADGVCRRRSASSAACSWRARNWASASASFSTASSRR
jgi:ABC transport permease subunit